MKSKIEVIEIPRLNIQQISLTLIGDSPLISHNWSEKSKREMLDKQRGVPKPKKANREPEAEYKASLYHHPDGGYGFPTIGVKACAVSACSQVDGVTKVDARATFHIDGELVKIKGEPIMREDMVRLMGGPPDLRYRAEFPEWETTFTLKFNASVLNPSQIANLFNTAGFGVGLGEWRPQKNGSYGRFHVK